MRLQYIGDQFNRLGNGTGDYIRYWYDADSNIIERDTMLNGSSIATPYDALHRMGSRTAKVGAAIMSKETYGYDNDMNRLVTVDRTEDNKRDSFGYDFSGQMTSANYAGAIPAATPTPVPTPTPAPGQVQPITFGYSGGYPDPLLVTMSCATAGATIFYTEEDNGYVNPTHSGGSATGTRTMVYSGPVRLAINQEKFFSALGYKSGMTDSGIAQRFVSNAGTTGPTLGPNTPATTPHSVSYTLDKAGNRTNVTDAGVSTPYTPNLINQYGSAGTPVTNGFEHEIIGYQGVNYTYINDGRLSRVSNGNNYWLYYDALGRCVRRILNGASTFYYYDGEKPILEQSGTVAAPVSNSNIYGIGPDEIVVRLQADYIYYFYQDHEGSVTHVRRSNSSVADQLVEQYRYDAFGAPTIRNAGGTVLGGTAIKNRFMYTGREWAPANLGFYEYRARAYHPGLGRFMSEDPKGFDAGDYNLFRYCNNDPEDRTDPMGLVDQTLPLGAADNRIAYPAGASQINNPIEQRQIDFSPSVAAHDVEIRAASAIGAKAAAIEGIQGRQYSTWKEAGKAGALADLKAIEMERAAGTEVKDLHEYWGNIFKEGDKFTVSAPQQGNSPGYVAAGEGGRPSGESGYSSSMACSGSGCIGYHYAHPRPADLIRNHYGNDIAGVTARREVIVAAAPRRGEPIASSQRPVFEAYNGATGQYYGPFY